MYQLCEKVLQEESEAKYLGITINNTLSWSSYVGVIAKKVSNTLNFTHRNLKYCSKDSKQMAYFFLVCSTMDYSVAVWGPHLKKDQHKLEMVDGRAARFVMNDYSITTSVTTMLDSLQWLSLELCHENQCLVLMHKIVHGLVAVQSTKLVPADDRTRSNHQYKFRAISASSSA